MDLNIVQQERVEKSRKNTIILGENGRKSGMQEWAHTKVRAMSFALMQAS
jgi:hypothetical protein